MTLGLAIIPDPRPGRPAYDAVVMRGREVVDKRRFDRRAEAEAWARRRMAELAPELFSLRERLALLGYDVETAPDPREGILDLWYAWARAEGRTVARATGSTEEEALRALAGELGLEVPR